MIEKKKLENFLWNNKIIILLFVLSTIFFVYQHTTGLSWDFSVYVLNAKYLFSGGHYFEWYRSPLTPFLLFVFSFLGYLISEYVYIIITSGLFAVACVKFSEKSNLNKNLFYPLMLSPFVLNFGLFAGTELLTLSLLILAISYINEKKSSLFFGLSFLARYTAIVYLPLLFFKKRWKKILLGIIIILIVFSPWMLFNYITQNHLFFSIADAYAFNIVSRQNTAIPFQLNHFLDVIGIYIIFFIMGLYLKWKRQFKKIDWIMLIFGILTILSYFIAPYKEPRYLFNLILPFAYFTTIFVHYLIKRIKHLKKEHLLTIIVLINFTLAGLFFHSLTLPAGFYKGVENADKGCMLLSNAWPYLNYLGIPSYPYPLKKNVGKHITEQDRRLLFYKTMEKPNYVRNESFLRTLPTLKETENYIILGEEDRCQSPPKTIDRTFIGWQKTLGNNITLCPVLPFRCG